MARRQILMISTFQVLTASYTPLNHLAFQMAIGIVSMINTLDSAKERKARLLCPSLITNVFSHLQSYQSFYLTGSVAAFKNAQLMFGYMVHPSSPTPEKTVIAKFHHPSYFHDEYDCRSSPSRCSVRRE